MDQIHVFVTGAGGGGIGEQIIKSLRNGKNSYLLISTDIRASSIAKNISDQFFVIPKADSPNYIDILISICLKNKCSILIPGSEPELLRISKSIQLFQQEGIYVPINHHSLIDLCLDKVKFQTFLSKNGFKLCESSILNSQVDLTLFSNYPYIIKPIKGSGSKNVFIVQDYNELKNIFNYLKDESSLLIQEYVGNPESEYTIGVLSNPAGYIKHIILQRDLSLGLSVKQSVRNKTQKDILGQNLVVSTGLSQGKFVLNELIDNVVQKIVLLLAPTSSINLQCRIHNGDVYIFEINPRFSGTSNLRAMVGFNEPEYIINQHFSITNENLNECNWNNRIVLRGVQEYLIDLS